jgi:hypothetical protein
MAKLPAIPNRSGMDDAEARRATARRRVRRPAPKKSGGGGSSFQLFVLGLGFIGMAVFAAPTCVLLVFGMVPSIVAYVVDRGKRPMQAFTIAPLNLAGLMPYLMQLWAGGDREQMPTVVHFLTDVYVWLVIYLAAGAGWLIFLGMPRLVVLILQSSLDRRKAKLKELQSKLKADWGPQVSGEESQI